MMQARTGPFTGIDQLFHKAESTVDMNNANTIQLSAMGAKAADENGVFTHGSNDPNIPSKPITTMINLCEFMYVLFR